MENSVTNSGGVEVQHHMQLMDFMKQFQNGIKQDIKQTNDKLDARLNILTTEMKGMNARIETQEDKTKEVQTLMDDRLNKLETEMTKYNMQQEKNREKIKELEVSRAATERVEDQTKLTEEQKSAGSPAKKRYQRRWIEKNDNYAAAEKEVEKQPSTFRSSWARQMEEQLSNMAGQLNRQKVDTADASKGMDHEKCNESAQPWEVLEKVQKTKTRIRKPVTLDNWFGAPVRQCEDSSSSSSQEEEQSWSEVDRKKVKLRKQNERRRKLREKRK